MTDLDTALIGAGLVLQAVSATAEVWGLRGRRKAEGEAKPEFLRDWMSRRDPKKMHPFPDGFGNQADEIRWAWKAVTVSQWTFGGAMITYWTLLGTTFFAGLPVPAVPLLVLAGVSAVGAWGYRHYMRYLTHKDRRYILAHIAVWMGFSLKNPHEIPVPADPDEKVAKVVDQHRRAIRRGRFHR